MNTDLLEAVMIEIAGVLGKVTRSEMSELVGRLSMAGRVFVAGEGRSGLIARAFAMRLMHLGLDARVIGETTTPAVAAGDTVVVVSGSGTTAGTLWVAEQARAAGATIYVVTTDPTSPLAVLADSALTVPASTKYRRTEEAATIQPLSSLFDQTVHVVLDVVCLELADRRGMNNTAARALHSNTE